MRWIVNFSFQHAPRWLVLIGLSLLSFLKVAILYPRTIDPIVYDGDLNSVVVVGANCNIPVTLVLISLIIL